MLGRRLLYDFMIASPILMLLALAIDARVTVPSFDVYNYAPKTHAQLLSYSPLVSEIQQLRHDRDQDKVAESARSIGQRWLDGRKTGKLESFQMTNILDSSRDGIKGQIRTNLDVLIATLSSNASFEFKTNTSRAIDDLTLAVGLSQSMKDTDVDSVGYFAMRERSLLRILSEVAMQCDETHLLEIQKLVDSIEIDREKLTRSIKLADLHYVRDGERWDENRSPILDPLSKTSRLLGKGDLSRARNSAMAALNLNLAGHVNTVSYSINSLENERVFRAEVSKSIAARLRKIQKSN